MPPGTPARAQPQDSAEAVALQRAALLELVQLDKSDLETSVPQLLRADARALRVERTSFWRLSDDKAALRCERLYELASGVTSAGAELRAQDFPSYFAAMLQNRVIDAPDARNDPRTREFTEPYLRLHDIHSMLDVPVWHRGQLVGVLCHEHVGEQRRWTSEEVDFALTVAGMLTAGLEGHERRHAEARYRMLTEAMQDLVWEWDLRTNKIAWTDAVFTALRFEPSQVRDSLDWWSENVHPADLDRVMKGLERHTKEGTGVWWDEYRFRRGDGSWAFVEDRGVLERAADGAPIRMVGAITDVSEKRLLQSRLLMKDRMAAIGTLAAGVAHEINNPLTYVGNNLRHALKLLSSLSEETTGIRQSVDEALVGVGQVQTIVRELKTFSRPDEVALGPVQPREVIESALGLAHNELAHRAKVRRQYEEVPAVLGNAARLGQVVLNLVVNAAQAIPEGRPEHHEVTVRTRGTGTKVVIEIRDTGPGIAPEHLKQVFDPFFTTKPVGVGTGLGLAICHSIVQSMGGTLTLENNPDRGATARLELDAAPQREVVAAKPTKPSTPDEAQSRTASGSARVLVVDDVLNVALSVKRLLEPPHQAEVMTSSRAALEAIARGQRWDVILCDLMMPDVGGAEFVEEVRRIAPELLPRITIMTGGAFTGGATRFLEEWPYKKLEKPFDPERLLEEIAAAARGE